jgi:hypothetical protein
MPVHDDSGAARTAGVYSVVRERIEEDARLHEERIASWAVDSADRPYPMQRILDALRAGVPVDVPAWALPQCARSDQRIAQERCAGSTATTGWMYGAVVHPDDTVTVEPDSGSRWLEYNGLL